MKEERPTGDGRWVLIFSTYNGRHRNTPAIKDEEYVHYLKNTRLSNTGITHNKFGESKKISEGYGVSLILTLGQNDQSSQHQDIEYKYT